MKCARNRFFLLLLLTSLAAAAPAMAQSLKLQERSVTHVSGSDIG
jgi:hypothetical protein